MVELGDTRCSRRTLEVKEGGRVGMGARSESRLTTDHFLDQLQGEPHGWRETDSELHQGG